MSDWHEVVDVIERLQNEFADLAIRGLRTVGPSHLASLAALGDELARINADHLADRIRVLIEAIGNDDGDAPVALLRAQTSLRLFERMLTQEVVTATLESMHGVGASALGESEDEL